MIVGTEHLQRADNMLLRALPAESYLRLRPYLQPVTFSVGEVLCEALAPASQSWFITSGLVSLLAMTGNGETVGVGLVGQEGMVGLPLLTGENSLPYSLVGQIAGQVLRLPVDLLRKEADEHDQLSKILFRYAGSLNRELTQAGLCNHFHSISERFCRLLLQLQDRGGAELVHLTHEMAASLLGVRRTGVSLVAARLQADGLIRYHRGSITITDRPGVEAAACECYQTLRSQSDQLLSA